MELGGRCPCGAVMGELGQNKQPTTHLGKIQKYQHTIQKYNYKIQNNRRVKGNNQ